MLSNHNPSVVNLQLSLGKLQRWT